mmetsp:Transcript_4936/g.6032  ORF Transcript_4936/g.6032 Transcript_4936/m.6032 type:complete len:301 (+) Transcript_4936:113-1015(+)
MPVFTDTEVEAFQQQGFIVLKNAFPRRIAIDCRTELWKILKEEKGIDQEDQDTWTEDRIGLKNVYTKDSGSPWCDVFTDRLFNGIDQLVGGRSKWSPDQLGCGWWVINFPMKDLPPWEACGNWHVDGAFFKHHVDSKEQGLLPIFLFNDILPEAGGTAVAVGSHLQIAKMLYENPQGLSVGEISRLALRQPGILDNVVEINGSAGDVALTHPFLLHARSKNLGTRGIDSVRFICNPCVGLKEKLNVHLNEGEDEESSKCSPVEKAIIRAKERSLVPFSFGRQKPPRGKHLNRYKKRRRRH